MVTRGRHILQDHLAGRTVRKHAFPEIDHRDASAGTQIFSNIHEIVRPALKVDDRYCR